MAEKKPLRTMAAPFVAPGPCGVAVRDRLRISPADVAVLAQVGRHMGSLAARDLAVRCRDGLGHDKTTWAVRKQELTGASSSRWAGAVTKSSHDQWALARRCAAARIQNLDAGIATVEARLALPVGEKGAGGTPGGYRSRQEWHTKSRRLAALEDRRRTAAADWQAGRVRVVRGGRRLANTRHHLDEAQLSLEQWRQRWDAARMFLSADGEAGKRFGNETIRIKPGGQVTVKLPAPLAHLANAPHGRYTLSGTVTFPHRGDEWRDRVEANAAVAYTIHHDPQRDRWYVTAAWQRRDVAVLPLDAALAAGCIGVDTNNDHLAAWRLDVHGNPVGKPRRFGYDLSGTAAHRDAQIRHALTRVLHWARQTGVGAIAVEDLDFLDAKTRERFGRKKRFRQLISRFPTGRLRARLTSMAAQAGIAVVAVDPAYTSRWGAEHWQQPTSRPTHKTTRHEAASLVIGRRAQSHPARRRTPPPRHDQSDRGGPRSVQTGPGNPVCEETRPTRTGPRTRSVHPPGMRTRETSLPKTVRDRRSDHDFIPAHWKGTVRS